MSKRVVSSIVFALVFILSNCTGALTSTPATGNQTPASPAGVNTLVPSGPAAPIVPGPTPMAPYLPTAPEKAVNLDGAEVVFIQGGTFSLGSSSTAAIKSPVELPETGVDLNSFYIYSHEVTNSQYSKCVAAGGCLDITKMETGTTSHYGDPAYDAYPVTGVDWLMAYDYCKWAGGRLPSEGEWEAAARSSNAFIYPWGNEGPTCDKTNMKSCSAEPTTVQVGSYPAGATPTKLYDMAGNVWEWVNDWWSPDHSLLAGFNPVGPVTGTLKVIKGGGYQSTPDRLRSAVRLGTDPGYGFDDLGFRCIANPLDAYSPVTPPAPVHHKTSGGERTVETGTGTRIDELQASISLIGTTCSCDGSERISFSARNSFGGTYSFNFDGTAWSCGYDSGSQILSCTGVPTAAPADGAAYRWKVSVTHPTLGVQAWAGLSGGESPVELSVCRGSPTHGGDAPAGVIGTVACPSGGWTAIRISSASVNIDSISINGATPPASACLGMGTRNVTCMTREAPVGGLYSLHLTTSGFSGSPTYTWDWDLRAPTDCTSRGETPMIQVTSQCNESHPGEYDVDINWTPGSARLDWLSGGVGFNVAMCTQVAPGRIYCAQAGNATGEAFLWGLGLVNDSGTTSTYSGSFLSPSHCIAGDERGSEAWRLAVNCRTDTSVQAIQLTINYPAGISALSYAVSDGSITPYGCIPDPFIPGQMSCSIPLPTTAPGPLRVCLTGADGDHCHTFDGYAGLIPTTCTGSTPEGDAWRFNEVTCSGSDGIEFSLHTPSAVNWIVGRAQSGTQTFACRQDPADPHRIVCGGSRPITTSPLEVCIADASGTEYCNSYADFASRVPTGCAPTGSEPEIIFRAVATCGESGRYSLDLAWQPADYFVYRVDDQVTGSMAACGDVVSGTLHCNNLRASVADGLLHVNVAHRASAGAVEETYHPLTVIPPSSCGTGSLPGGNGFTFHDITCAPGGYSFLLDYPSSMTATGGSGTVGATSYACVPDATAARRLVCSGPVFTLPASVSITLHLIDGSTVPLTAEFPASWTLPTCGTDPAGNDGWGVSASCIPVDNIQIRITTPVRPIGDPDPLIAGTRVWMWELPATGNEIIGVSQIDPDPSTLHVQFQDSTGRTYIHDFPEYPAIAPRSCSPSTPGGGEPRFTTTVSCGPDKNWLVRITPSDPLYSVLFVDYTSWPTPPECTFNSDGSALCSIGMLDSDGKISLTYGWFAGAEPGGTMVILNNYSEFPPDCPFTEPTGEESGWSMRQGCGLFSSDPEQYGYEITAPSFNSDEFLRLNSLPAGCGSSWIVALSNQMRVACATPVPADNLVVAAWSNDGRTELGSHDFGPANASAPATCGGQPAAGGWDIQAWCENGHPHLRLFPDPSLGIIQAVINTMPGWTAWVTSLSSTDITAYTPIDVIPAYDWSVTDSLTWTFPGPAPDYAPITHTFTGLRSIIPAECGGGGTTPPPQQGITPTPSSGQLQCWQITEPNSCGNHGCYWWWSNNTCNSNPEPPPVTCSDITDQGKCTSNGCYWWSNNTCNDTKEPVIDCTSYNDQTSCEKAGICKWDGKYCYKP